MIVSHLGCYARGKSCDILDRSQLPRRTSCVRECMHWGVCTNSFGMPQIYVSFCVAWVHSKIDANLSRMHTCNESCQQKCFTQKQKLQKIFQNNRHRYCVSLCFLSYSWFCQKVLFLGTPPPTPDRRTDGVTREIFFVAKASTLCSSRKETCSWITYSSSRHTHKNNLPVNQKCYEKSKTKYGKLSPKKSY